MSDERRCDGYAILRPELHGVTFCRKEGARVVGEIVEQRDALKAQRDRLQMLLTIALIAVDMPPAKPDEPWVRLVEAAHAHGRKLQREEDDGALREALKMLQAVTEALEGGLPTDEAAEFPDVPLAEAWKRRCAARAFLAKHPVQP